ncbi:ceramide glucosyltransferase [Pseudoruegeria sp. SK021]|nr:ceramide glucosyltransferase [Pseudoruegeria sp. SK021]
MMLLSKFAALTTAAHLISVALVFRRVAAPRAAVPVHLPPLTVLRPVCGLDPTLAETLETTFSDRSADIEVIFCIASAEDPAIGLVRRIMAQHPDVPSQLLIGEDPISGNPKLNNLAKGWAAAQHDWIVMIDSNVALPPSYIGTLFATWRPGTGLVTSPPAGTHGSGLWAALEAAFLNTYQDRWQLAADELGTGFAQGKVLFWRRDILENAGGVAALGHDLAEDIASTRLVRQAGLKVRVVRHPFPQPLGHRKFREVWQRQVRWAQVRRAGFPALFATEILSGALPPLAALCVSGALPSVALILFLALWYGAEWLLARRAGWPAGPLDIVSWLVRDALIPAIWLASFTTRGIVWRGNQVRNAPETVAAGE